MWVWTTRAVAHTGTGMIEPSVKRIQNIRCLDSAAESFGSTSTPSPPPPRLISEALKPGPTVGSMSSLIGAGLSPAIAALNASSLARSAGMAVLGSRSGHISTFGSVIDATSTRMLRRRHRST